MIKPLIKYTGGKYKEYDKFKTFLPLKIENYFEPFFGGGGVLFRLHNEDKIKKSIFINDISESLVDFYTAIKKPEFIDTLYALSDAWDYIRNFANDFAEKYKQDFVNEIESQGIKFINEDKEIYIKKNIIDLNLATHNFSLIRLILDSLESKFNRFKNKKLLTGELVNVSYDCLATAICQAFYFLIRNMYNDWNVHGNKNKYTLLERSAQYMFIREYCFGSMFRFGKNGDFNIPYGGRSYNDKCFRCKIENAVSEETRNLFSKINLSCTDFENAITDKTFVKDDFMFLDPPYDSTFTDYDNDCFGHNEHIRLANLLKKIDCKWLMIINKTDFITELYKDFNISAYDKTYMYQAKGEYDSKHTTHLVIRNY